MLSWICPECGRENDPAFQECPGCTPGPVKRQPDQPHRAGRREPPPPAPVSLTFETDCATAPFIDLESLRLSVSRPSAPAPLARGVRWEARERMTPARAAERPPEILEGAMPAGGRTDSPAATALATLGTTALALAPRVAGPPDPIVFRTLARVSRGNPLPAWSATVHGSVLPDFVPDHSSIRGMESDLPHLLEALRQSPSCALLTAGGDEDAPLPARLRDVEYAPAPRAQAPSVPWRPVVRAADRPATVENLPCAGERWPECGLALPRTAEIGLEDTALSQRAEGLFGLSAGPQRQPPPAWKAPSMGSAVASSADVRLPSELRGFHESGILSLPHVVRYVHGRAPVPGWMITSIAVVLTLLSLWILGTSTLADRFTIARADASSPSDAAESAFPTLSKYVEVTGVRASEDTRTSEIRYLVVNHSAAELPPFLLAVKLRPRRGGAAVCSFSEMVQNMGPNESREMRTVIPRELHSYELPEWRDLRVEAQVTAKQ